MVGPTGMVLVWCAVKMGVTGVTWIKKKIARRKSVVRLCAGFMSWRRDCRVVHR